MMESKLAFLFWKILEVLFYSGSSDQAHTSVLSPTNNSCRQSFQSHYNAHTPKRTAIRVGSLSTQHNTCFYRLDVIPAVLNRPDNKKPNESQLHEEYLCLTWIKMLDTSRFSMNNVSQNISNCSSTRFPRGLECGKLTQVCSDLETLVEAVQPRIHSGFDLVWSWPGRSVDLKCVISLQLRGLLLLHRMALR